MRLTTLVLGRKSVENEAKTHALRTKPDFAEKRDGVPLEPLFNRNVHPAIPNEPGVYGDSSLS
jgi:hypothetical protein